MFIAALFTAFAFLFSLPRRIVVLVALSAVATLLLFFSPIAFLALLVALGVVLSLTHFL